MAPSGGLVPAGSVFLSRPRERSRCVVPGLYRCTELLCDSSSCRSDQVTLFNQHGGDRHDGQVKLERAPAAPVIQRVIGAALGAGKQQPLTLGISTQYPGEMSVRNT